MPSLISMLTRPKAEDPLADHVAYYVRQGYRVLSQTDASTQLVKPKQFSLVWFFLMLGVFYIPWYVAKKDKAVYLMASDGKVRTN